MRLRGAGESLLRRRGPLHQQHCLLLGNALFLAASSPRRLRIISEQARVCIIVEFPRAARNPASGRVELRRGPESRTSATRSFSNCFEKVIIIAETGLVNERVALIARQTEHQMDVGAFS